MLIDEQILALFQTLSEGREGQAAEFVGHLRRGGVAAFQRVFLGQIQTALPTSDPTPLTEPLPEKRHDERGFLLPQYRTPSTLMPKNRPGPPPPDFSKGEGWAF
jgi:hypothetical protein